MSAAPALYEPGTGRMVGRGGMPFTDEQAAAIGRRDGALLVSANAGSGKTSVLSERFVRSVLEDELEPGRVLALTFTDKAAGELRARIRARFVELGRRDRARDLEAAWISTFHGLCARILRAHAVRAGLDPAFTVLEEAEARDVRGTAFETALAGWLAGERPEALDLAAAYGVDALADLVLRTHDALRSAGQTRPSLPVVAAPPAPDPAPLAAAVAAAHAALAGAEGRSVDTARAALERGAALAGDPAPSLRALEQAAFRPGNVRVLRGDACTAYLEALERHAGAVRDGLAARALVLLDELLGRHADAYAEAKRARGRLDFDDLELLTRDLLRDAPAVRESYARRFERVMVDEFQDTNHVQLDLLDLLGGDRFVVGDELQSIYGFRHADVGIFRAARTELGARGAAAELATNFRSRPAILAVIDAATGALHGPAHVPFRAGRAAADGADADVELLLTDAAAVDAWPPEALASLPAAPTRRRGEARVVAARVAAMIREEGVAPGDVVILLRAATDMAVFERALEEQGLTTLAAGGRGYWGRQQVLDLCAFLGALANPRDELALFGLLASPLVGVGADGLAVLAQTVARGSRWDALVAAYVEDGEAPWTTGLPDADHDALVNFCPWFAAERERAPRLGLDELLERVIDRTGYDLHVLGLPGGRRRWANVLKLQRLAAGFEARRGRDLRGLIDLATAELEAQARESDAPVEAVPSAATGAVRLMTMHAAKGLEFGVVVVADLGRAARLDADDLLVDGGRIGLRLRTVDGGTAKTLHWEALRDARAVAAGEEERRILHVAMTRAEDRLVLSGTFEADRWLGTPQPGAAPLRWLAPRLVAGLTDALADAPDGVPWAADPDAETVAGRVAVRVHREPPPAAPGAPAPVAAEAPGPGLPEPPVAPGGQLALDLFGEAPALAPPGPATPAGPLPHTPAPAARPGSVPGFALPAALSYTSLAAYERCAYRWYLERVLRLPRDDADAALAASLRETTEAAPGLDPLVRGSLAHLLLEEVDFARPVAPAADTVRALAALHDADLTDADVADLQALVAAIADGPLAARLAAAPDVRREHGFVVGLGDDAAPLLHGVIDVLAFEPGGGALVVDYKSDAVAPGADLAAHVEAAYGIQRRIYALAALGAGAADVEVAHLYLARPGEPVVAVFDRAGVPALQAELRARIADLRDGRFTPSDRPHRGLCLGCPGRRALCHHPEELTLREAP